VFGGFRPSFGLEYPAWNATNIALVEITPQDGDFIVLESWKGNLKAGEHVIVPQLMPGPHAVPIALYSKLNRPFQPSGEGSLEAIPKQPVGSRMVPFLRRDGRGEGAPSDLSSESPEWQPADVYHNI
jgi:hypothetical protein